MVYKKITLPLDSSAIESLESGDMISLSGVLFGARDKAHKLMEELISNGQPLPFEPEGQVIYYVGPTPGKPGNAGKLPGVAGPTTSKRMDIYTPSLLSAGIKGMLGKGRRSAEIQSACRDFGALYLGAVGGAAAYLTKSIKNMEILAFPELGPEAIWKIEVVDFPAIVLIDSQGKNFIHFSE